MWFYVELKIGGLNMALAPNDIIFSVDYANGATCSKSFENVDLDLIGPIGSGNLLSELYVGRSLDGIVGGLESWRAWRNWEHTVSKSCHAACMPNWCLEDADSASCFPSGIYVNTAKSTQQGNKFTLYLSRLFDQSTHVATCADILTTSPSLGTHSVCSYDQARLTVYVGNGHQVTTSSKICIDPTKALPAYVLTTSDYLNCMDVATNLPTVAITVSTTSLHYTDPITITASTANLPNVVTYIYTYVFETVSGPTTYIFSSTNETSKSIPAQSLLPGAYEFKVYLAMEDSGNFAPNATVAIEVLYPTLTSSSQIGNRFYFNFSQVIPTVTDCTLVNVGLDFLGTGPSCSSSGEELTIESNISDSSYVTGSTIGISEIITSQEESFTVLHGRPTLTGSVTPNSPEWDAGAEHEWKVVLAEASSLTIAQWTWTKVSGPDISFASNQSTQSYQAETLQLGGSYVLEVALTFTNSPWITLTHQFTPQKLNFALTTTQEGLNFTIIISDSRLSINTCSDIFDPATVTNLGASATCLYNTETSTLQVNPSTDNSLKPGDILVYDNADLMSTISNYVIIGSNINLEIKQEPINPKKPSIFEAVITYEDTSTSSVDILYRDYSIEWTILPEISTTSITQISNILNIAKGALEPGKDYVIKCKVTDKKDAVQTAEATVSVSVPASMRIGTLDISPSVGNAFETYFSLKANNWEDPSGGDLKYKFEYRMFGANTYLPKIDRSEENTATGVQFPPGLDQNNNLIEVIVRVASSTGITAHLVQTITVNPIIIEDTKKFVEDNLEQATTSAEVIQAVGETTFLLIEKPAAVLEEDVCGGCETKYGKCNIESKLCECDLEYSQHKYCKVKNTRITEMTTLSKILATGIFTKYIYIYIYYYYI